jgi:integrase
VICFGKNALGAVSGRILDWTRLFTPFHDHASSDGPSSDKHPVELVRQSTRRTRVPRVLTPEEFRKLLAELEESCRTMVLIAGSLGLRISENLGLRWADINWDSLTLLVQRSVVYGKVYGTKTEASRKPMPIDPQIAEALLTYRRQAVYVGQGDYIFAGDNGKPRWGGIMLTDHIKPAAVRAGIGKVGWHTSRHTFRSCTRQEPALP